MIVYQAYNPITNSYYVGKTTKPLHKRRLRHEQDAMRHRGNSVFHKAIRKYGIGVFDWCVLHYAITHSDLNIAERRWIALVRVAGHKLYNLRPGGDGGSYPGEDNPNFGRIMPEEQKVKISNGLREYYKDKPGTMTGRKGSLSSFFGQRHTEDTKKRIAESQKKRKDRLYMQGAANPSARSILCVTTSESFSTATEAANKYNCDISSIIKCCRGKINKVKGLVFKYKEPGVFGWVQA